MQGWEPVSHGYMMGEHTGGMTGGRAAYLSHIKSTGRWR